jgi:hypothetical protein
MKRNFTFLTIVVLAIVFTISVNAQETQIVAKQFAKAPIIDGQLDAIWGEADSLKAEKVLDASEGNTIFKGDDDCISILKVGWKDDTLYILQKRWDDYWVDTSVTSDVVEENISHRDGNALWFFAQDVIEGTDSIKERDSLSYMIKYQIGKLDDNGTQMFEMYYNGWGGDFNTNAIGWMPGDSLIYGYGEENNWKYMELALYAPDYDVVDGLSDGVKLGIELEVNDNDMEYDDSDDGSGTYEREHNLFLNEHGTGDIWKFPYEAVELVISDEIIVTTGIVGNSIAGNFHVYPIPADNVIHVRSGLLIENIEVYSLTGQKIITSSLANKIDISGLTSGIYMLKLNTKSAGVYVRKVVIK